MAIVILIKLFNIMLNNRVEKEPNQAIGYAKSAADGGP